MDRTMLFPFINAILVLFLLLAAFIGLYSLYIYYVRNVKYRHFPHTKPKHFFWGHAIELFGEEGKTGVYRGYKWLQWAETLGPTFCIFILHRVIIISGDPVVIKELLTHSKYPKSKSGYERTSKVYGMRLLGNGIVTNTDHESWKKRRKVFDPAFHKKSLMNIMNYFNEGANKFLDKLELFADGHTGVCMADIIGRVTLDVIGKVAFDMDINSLDDPNNKFPAAINLCLMSLTKNLKNPYFMYLPWNWAEVEKTKDSLKLLRNFGQMCFEKRMKIMENEEEVPNDILTSILNQFRNDDTLTMEDLIDDFITFFIAGQETTSNAVSFVLLMLADHPDIRDRVIEEIEAVLGDKQQLEYSDIGKLEYLDQVWKESLRLFPTAPGTLRDIPSATEINGIKYPSNSCVLMSFFVAHRYIGNYTDPDMFQPDRFAEGQTHVYCYLPFSLGMRSCIGSHFAWMEGKTLLARFLQSYEYELIPGQGRGLREATTLKPAGGVMCTLNKRKRK